MIYSIGGKVPNIATSSFVAPSADIIGDVTLGACSSVWFQAVVRADKASIFIGEGSNLQDGVIAHADELFPLTIGNNVTVGHGAIIHGCTIGNSTLIGMGATILNGAIIGEESLIAAGAVVTEGMLIPNRSVVMGVPARIMHQLTDDLAVRLQESADHYTTLISFYASLEKH